MFPLVPTLALALVSLISSAFVILRIVIPILPPHPLSRRVPPSEFGLPNFKTLSPADKSHLWLASLDLIALVIFVWQALTEYLGGVAGFDVASDPASAVRLWIATTLRQSCLLIVAALTLLHVRLGRSVAFGRFQWMLWVPTLLLTGTSTTMAGILAVSGVKSFFWGLLGYSTMVAALSSVAFTCLIGTLVIIRRNLNTLGDMRDPWPPAPAVAVKSRASFGTEDVDALKDGSSWITSHASSRRDSISAFSYSTHHTSHSRILSNASSRILANPGMASDPSILAKSSFWFHPAMPGNGRLSPVPPVPPLPAPYRPSTAHSYNVDDDPDPFRGPEPRPRSQSSWLTEPSAYQSTLSAWSFPASEASTSFPSTPVIQTGLLPSMDMPPPSPVRSLSPAMVTTDILGGYGYAGEASRAESGAAPSVQPGSEVDVSVYRTIGWLIMIWVPMFLALPYYITIYPMLAVASPWATYLLIVSMTISSPLLAANILLRSPLPIPSGLFDTPTDLPSVVMRAASPASTYVNGYKRSGSVTVVEGSRSGDIWLANGDAVENKGTFGRAVGLLQPKPKLSVMPLENGDFKDLPPTPTLPTQDAHALTVPAPPLDTSNTDFNMSQEMGTRKKDSKASSYFSNAEENFATQIMIAQRHYSTLAMTMVVPPSPKRRASVGQAATTAVETPSNEVKRSGHLRARSRTFDESLSVSPSPAGAPPSTPLPPTPPPVKNFKLNSTAKRLVHRKSYSSTADEFSFGPVDDTNITEIDALSAGLLPMLVPGLKVGNDVKITESWKRPPSITSRDAKKRKSRLPSQLNGVFDDFSSPQMHSTPVPRKTEAHARSRKSSGHNRNHYSLPSLNLSTDSVQAVTTWRQDLNRAIDNRMSTMEPETHGANANRNTVYEGDFTTDSEVHISALQEGGGSSFLTTPTINHPYSARYDATLDVPDRISGHKRNSITSLISALSQSFQVPPSASSEVTLFDFNFDPSADGLAESTPQESKIQPRRSTESAVRAPEVPAKRSSTVHLAVDENTAPAIVVRPLSVRSKADKAKARTSQVEDQENETSVDRKGLRPLSLLRNFDANATLVEDDTSSGTRPLSLNSKKKGSKAARADGENAHHESPLKKALKPLKLGRNSTTKERAKLRKGEVIPAVIVRPPSGTFGRL